MRWFSFCLLLVVAFQVSSDAQQNYPPEFDDARAETYKSVDGVELNLWVFEPEDHKPSDARPTIVFFFGGGWKKGTPGQFEQHCRYLASRGMVAITADYRVLDRHKTLANKCVSDAKSAIRYVRKNADRLGVDPNRIVAGGGSAGGHLAACTGVVPGFDEASDDLSVSCVPNAMALFNPALVLSPIDGVSLPQEKLEEIAARAGAPLKDLAPITHVRRGLPPTIIFHGTADDAVAFATARKYTEFAVAAGNRCELDAYRGEPHGFFNYGRGGDPGESFARTLSSLDRFLASLGYLSGEPTISIPKSRNVHPRASLNNSRITFERTGKGSVAFIGGSITQMNGYRPMVADFLVNRFPKTEFHFTNAGISSTCSTTGAFRLARDVLSTKPDLLFVEFAVNDDQDAAHAARECLRGMEGILRQALTDNPMTDIVVTHFVNPPMLEKLQNGKTPVSSGQHERVAKHYQVATNDLAREVAERIDAGTLTWKIYGGTHPKEAGNRLAADQIADLLSAAWRDPLPESAKPIRHRIPKVMDDRSYYRGRLLAPNLADADQKWSFRVPNWSELKGGSREQFRDTKLLCASDPTAELSLKFDGSAIGAYILAGPDAGIVEVSVDDEEFRQVDLYHRFSKGLHYPRTVMFASDLPTGKHRLRLRISKDSNGASIGNAVRILQFTAN